MPARTFWTATRLALIRDLAGRGLRAPAIARAAAARWGEPVTAGAVRHAAHRAGIRLALGRPPIIPPIIPPEKTERRGAPGYNPGGERLAVFPEAANLVAISPAKP